MAFQHTKEAHAGETPNLKTPGAGALWRAAEQLKTFTVSELANEAGVPDATARHCVGMWEVEGFFVLHARAARKLGGNRYRIAQPAARPYGPETLRLWQAMRRLDTFSHLDLSIAASVEGGAVSEENTARFVATLIAAGYVRQRYAAVKGKSPARYKLIKDTGPRPPFKRRVTIFIDPNTGETLLPEDYRK